MPASPVQPICDPLKIQIPQSSSPSSSAESGLSSSLSPPSPSIPSGTRKSQSTTSLLYNNASSGMRITFAPLPSPEPRMRRSTSQLKLGVASRSSMMRPRPSASVNLNNADQEGLGVQEGRARNRQQPSASERWQDYAFSKPKRQGERSRDPDDPLLAMGRLVKSAWRRVSSSQTRTQPQERPVVGNNRLEECGAPEDGFSEGEEGQQQYSHDNSPIDCVVEERDSGTCGDGHMPKL